MRKKILIIDDDQELNEQMTRTKNDASSDDFLANAQKEQSEREKSRAHMEQLMSGLQDPKYGKSLQSTLKSLSSTSEGVENVDQLFDQLAKQFESNLKSTHMPGDPNNPEEIQSADREVAATMQMISSAQQGMEGFEAGKMEEVGETMMEDMMAQFESLGEKEDYNEVSYVLLVCFNSKLQLQDSHATSNSRSKYAFDLTFVTLSIFTAV